MTIFLSLVLGFLICRLIGTGVRHWQGRKIRRALIAEHEARLGRLREFKLLRGGKP